MQQDDVRTSEMRKKSDIQEQQIHKNYKFWNYQTQTEDKNMYSHIIGDKN